MNDLGEMLYKNIAVGEHVIARNEKQNQVVSGTIINNNEKFLVVEIGHNVTVTLDKNLWKFFTRNR